VHVTASKRFIVNDFPRRGFYEGWTSQEDPTCKGQFNLAESAWSVVAPTNLVAEL
jgi:hypothetical protein